MPGIYAAVCGDMVKLGRTKHPNRRRQQLSAPNGMKIEEYVFIPLRLSEAQSCAELEAAMHERFKASRVEGEWFKCDADTIGFVDSWRDVARAHHQAEELVFNARMKQLGS